MSPATGAKLTEQALNAPENEAIPIKGNHVLFVSALDDFTGIKYFSQKYFPRNENITIFYILNNEKSTGLVYSGTNTYSVIMVPSNTSVWVVYWPEKTIAGHYNIPAIANGTRTAGSYSYTNYRYGWMDWVINLPGFKPEMKKELDEAINQEGLTRANT
ncbi:MAG: hypothetical protein HZC47_04005 [Methanobacterium sp.]|uniref:hypothetical protein n=1 Tax=Methanobacterium sp. TaxID=2164 RepID=UPI003D65B8D6|nr:hypothetical protein [Methanobacterium sp.]